MNNTRVGTKAIASVDGLRTFLSQFATADCYYFARWSHRVSGMVQDLDKAFPSPEGQLFGTQFELRWKQCRDKGYELLLLHCERSVENWGFQPVASAWEVSEPLGAYLYQHDETRFPKGFNYPPNLRLQQRYFQDAATATVHFVALTLAS